MKHKILSTLIGAVMAGGTGLVAAATAVGLESSACGNIDQNNRGNRGEDDKFSIV